MVLSAACLAASARQAHLSDDPQVNHARSLIEDGQFSEALLILRPLAPDHPDQTDVLFLVGLAALGAAQLSGADNQQRDDLLDEAVAALHAILIDRPSLVRVRLELARAFFLKGDDDLSREHFERVLAGKPPLAMVANIRLFLNAIAARRRWSGYFGATLAPDSNINASSDAQTINIHGLSFRRDANAAARSGLGVVLRGGGEYQHPLSEQLRLRIGADVARREYGGSNFDQTFLSAHVGPRWLNSATEINLLGSIRRRWAAGSAQSREFGGRFEMQHRLFRRLLGNTRASWHRRDYDRDNHLDGSQAALSLGLVWQATSTMQADVRAGYSSDWTREPVWRNSSRWLRLGISNALPRGFTIGASAELTWTGYQGNWAPFVVGGGGREDATRILRGSVFNRALTMFGFSPELALVHEARDSNAQLYDYRRYRAELQFVRQF